MTRIDRTLPVLTKHARPYRTSVFQPCEGSQSDKLILFAEAGCSLRSSGTDTVGEVLYSVWQILEDVRRMHENENLPQFNFVPSDLGDLPTYSQPPPRYLIDPCDFSNDSWPEVHSLGTLLREIYLDNNPSLRLITPFTALVGDMTDAALSRRPELPDVLARFADICAGLETRTLRAPARPFRTARRLCARWGRRVIYILGLTPLLSMFNVSALPNDSDTPRLPPAPSLKSRASVLISGIKWS
ncbi:hypothetical protein DFH09DRAFT_1368727 [Mycena vulgaris]|nr:hypothetical protein DFH09DRAFT_1368727 [Mycena vulgaris]